MKLEGYILLNKFEGKTKEDFSFIKNVHTCIGNSCTICAFNTIGGKCLVSIIRSKRNEMGISFKTEELFDILIKLYEKTFLKPIQEEMEI